MTSNKMVLQVFKNQNTPKVVLVTGASSGIGKAIAKKPKTRYVAGKLARPLILMRKLLSDRIFDKVIMSAG
jgi:23S rRNA pseudoU1915 N3-methylase RlmH